MEKHHKQEYAAPTEVGCVFAGNTNMSRLRRCEALPMGLVGSEGSLSNSGAGNHLNARLSAYCHVFSWGAKNKTPFAAAKPVADRSAKLQRTSNFQISMFTDVCRKRVSTEKDTCIEEYTYWKSRKLLMVNRTRDNRRRNTRIEDNFVNAEYSNFPMIGMVPAAKLGKTRINPQMFGKNYYL